MHTPIHTCIHQDITRSSHAQGPYTPATHTSHTHTHTHMHTSGYHEVKPRSRPIHTSSAVPHSNRAESFKIMEQRPRVKEPPPRVPPFRLGGRLGGSGTPGFKPDRYVTFLGVKCVLAVYAHWLKNVVCTHAGSKMWCVRDRVAPCL
jgi:hypothetical protein